MLRSSNFSTVDRYSDFDYEAIASDYDLITLDCETKASDHEVTASLSSIFEALNKLLDRKKRLTERLAKALASHKDHIKKALHRTNLKIKELSSKLKVAKSTTAKSSTKPKKLSIAPKVAAGLAATAVGATVYDSTKATTPTEIEGRTVSLTPGATELHEKYKGDPSFQTALSDTVKAGESLKAEGTSLLTSENKPAPELVSALADNVAKVKPPELSSQHFYDNSARMFDDAPESSNFLIPEAVIPEPSYSRQSLLDSGSDTDSPGFWSKTADFLNSEDGKKMIELVLGLLL